MGYKEGRKHVVNVGEFLRFIAIKILLEGLCVCRYIGQEPGNTNVQRTYLCQNVFLIDRVGKPCISS